MTSQQYQPQYTQQTPAPQQPQQGSNYDPSYATSTPAAGAHTGQPGGQYASPSGPPPGHNPQGQYAAPSGAPPAHGQYAPPPGAPQGYPAQPQFPGGLPTMMPQPAYAPQAPYGHIMFLAVPVPDPAAPRQPPAQQVPGFDFAATKASIDKTKKMMSIDEKTLIEVMLSITIPQMHALDSYIRELKKESLVKYLKDLIGMKSNSAFTAVICALAAGPVVYDAELAFQAVDGIGRVTNEEKLNEVLLARDHQEMVALRKAYENVLQEKKKDSKRTLYSDVEKDLSGVDWELFRGAIETQRLPENAQPVDHARVQADYAALMNATTDKAELFKILNNAPKNHLAAVYQTGVENGINLNSKDHFKSRFSADKDLRDSLRYLFGAVTSMKAYDGLYGIRQDAELLAESDEKQLTYRIVRGHWNAKRWAAVKEQFQSTKGASLEDYVKKKTSGSLEDILVALVRKK